MAKILFGVCGEGMGHASRSRILINYLLKKKYELQVVAGGKAYKFLSKDFDFVHEIEWPGAVYKNNKIAAFHMLFKFFYKTLISSTKSYIKVKKIINEFKPDLLLTDGEPISYSAAVFNKIKWMSIDNPTAVLYRKYKVELGEYLGWFGLYIALILSRFNAEKYIIYDFSDEQIDNKKVLFLKPLIQEGILKQKSSYGSHIFVYQTSISYDEFFKKLKNIDEKFVIYGFNKNLVDGNLIYKKFNENEFYHDISSAKAIITNGGFTVISEALFLKKPVFSLPIINQFEQILNGKFMEKLGAGIYHMNFDEKKFRDFLYNLENYKQNLKVYNPGNQEQILKRIEEEIKLLVSC
jgi:uncharacterized protein (TIGR00661 family)